jgi:hypothetical protein
MDRSFWPSAAPAFGAASGTTKAGNRERKRGESHGALTVDRNRAEPAGFEVNTGGISCGLAWASGSGARAAS